MGRGSTNGCCCRIEWDESRSTVLSREESTQSPLVTDFIEGFFWSSSSWPTNALWGGMVQTYAMGVLTYDMVVVTDKLEAIRQLFGAQTNKQTDRQTNKPIKGVSNSGSSGSLV
jgi:hypothetical protein